MGTRGRGVALTLCVLMEHHHQSLRLAYLSRTRPGQAMAGRSMVTNTKVTHKHLLVSYIGQRTHCLSSYSTNQVEGTCLVLELDEYCTQRPTQHKESDVYCCESYYDEEKRVITPLPSTLKKYQHGLKVKKDEVYVFKRPISPQKVAWLKPVSITDCSGDEENYENEEDT